MDYLEKLKDPRWQKKRLEVLERDGWQCKWCGGKENTLHVHHLFYFKDKEPWEIPSGFLITLCENCHNLVDEEFLELIGSLLNKIWACGYTAVDLPLIQGVLEWVSHYHEKGTANKDEVLKMLMGRKNIDGKRAMP